MKRRQFFVPLGDKKIVLYHENNILDQPHECNRHNQQVILGFLKQYLWGGDVAKETKLEVLFYEIRQNV